jgi:hypothetical protein
MIRTRKGSLATCDPMCSMDTWHVLVRVGQRQHPEHTTCHRTHATALPPACLDGQRLLIVSRGSQGSYRGLLVIALGLQLHMDNTNVLWYMMILNYLLVNYSSGRFSRRVCAVRLLMWNLASVWETEPCHQQKSEM